MAGWNETAEPWVPEPPPKAPRYVERNVPTCPECGALCRRSLNAHGEGRHGAWRCGSWHGEVEPVWVLYEVPTGDEEE